MQLGSVYQYSELKFSLSIHCSWAVLYSSCTMLYRSVYQYTALKLHFTVALQLESVYQYIVALVGLQYIYFHVEVYFAREVYPFLPKVISQSTFPLTNINISYCMSL